MVNAGAIPSLVALVDSSSPEACENATAVLSELARTQGGTKKAIVQAGGIEPLIQLLTDASVQTQRHAACALWGLADGKEGVYDKQIVEQGALRPLIAMLMLNHPETRGFAAACLSCCCADDDAKKAIRDANGAAPLLALLHSPSGWLRQQAMEMLKTLEIPFNVPETSSPRPARSPRQTGTKASTAAGLSQPLLAQKLLPIRTSSSIDPEVDNPKVGELKRGEVVFLIESQEVAPATWRARIAIELGGTAKGWVTQSRSGTEFLIAEGSPGSACLTQAQKYKFHFFSFQLGRTDSAC